MSDQNTIPIRIGVIDTSTSRKVGEGIDPDVRAAFLATAEPPPAPKFKESATVYHRASGTKAVVLAQLVRCSNPAHAVAHARGEPPDRPDCALAWTGDYVVSTDFGDELIAPESELVEAL